MIHCLLCFQQLIRGRSENDIGKMSQNTWMYVQNIIKNHVSILLNMVLTKWFDLWSAVSFWSNGAGSGDEAPLSSECESLTDSGEAPAPTTPFPGTTNYPFVSSSPPHSPHTPTHSHHYNTYLINTFLTYPTPFLLLPLPANDLFTGTCGTRVSSHHVCARRGCWHTCPVCDTLQTLPSLSIITTLKSLNSKTP